MDQNKNRRIWSFLVFSYFFPDATEKKHEGKKFKRLFCELLGASGQIKTLYWSHMAGKPKFAPADIKAC